MARGRKKSRSATLTLVFNGDLNQAQMRAFAGVFNVWCGHEIKTTPERQALFSRAASIIAELIRDDRRDDSKIAIQSASMKGPP